MSADLPTEMTAAEYLAWQAAQRRPSGSRATGKRGSDRLRARLDALAAIDPPLVLAPPAPPRADIDEAAFQSLIVALARQQHWIVWHDRDSRGNDEGLPDLILCRERLLWWELKTERGKVGEVQMAFGARLIRAGQEWRILRPRDWGYIVATLTKRIG